MQCCFVCGFPGFFLFFFLFFFFIFLSSEGKAELKAPDNTDLVCPIPWHAFSLPEPVLFWAARQQNLSAPEPPLSRDTKCGYSWGWRTGYGVSHPITALCLKKTPKSHTHTHTHRQPRDRLCSPNTQAHGKILSFGTSPALVRSWQKEVMNRFMTSRRLEALTHG